MWYTKDLSNNGIARLIGVLMIFNLLQSCSGRSKFEALIGSPVVESRVEEGSGFRRKYYVFTRSVGDSGGTFDSICSKISKNYSDSRLYSPGVLNYEEGKFGYLPDISRQFDAKFTSKLTRYYSLMSKDRMSVIKVYETEKHVCVLLADG